MWPLLSLSQLHTLCVGGLPAHMHGMCRMKRLGIHLG